MSDSLPFITASFDPSGTRFASAYQALSSHRVRVSPVLSTGNMQPIEIALDKSVRITCLAWVPSSGRNRTQTGKTQRLDADESVVILGTLSGQLLVWNPKDGAITAKLGDAGTASVIGLVAEPGHALSLRADGTVTQWDLAKQRVLRSFKAAVVDPSAIEMLGDSRLVIASAAPCIFSMDQPQPEKVFSGFASRIRQICRARTRNRAFVCSAEEDRQLQVYVTDANPLKSLVCPSYAVHSFALSKDDSALAAVTEDGLVHIFASPFEQSNTPAVSTSKKTRIAVRPTLSPVAFIRVRRPDGALVRVQNVVFSDNFLILSWSEQGCIPVFEMVQWIYDGEICRGEIEISKELLIHSVTESMINGVDPAAVTQYVDVAVTSGAHIADLESDNENEDVGAGNTTLAERLEALDDKPLAKFEDEDEDVVQQSRPNVRTTTKGTFAVLLSQALTSGDKQLLEQCLVEKNEQAVKLSIIMLKPELAAQLVEQLAIRISRRQQRTQQLFRWIKWVVVAHGPYLLTMPNLMKTLASLHALLVSRIATLPRLLALEGRLELLLAQNDIRLEQLKYTQDVASPDEDEPEVIYDEEPEIVYGEEDFDQRSEEDLEIEDDVSEDDDF